MRTGSLRGAPLAGLVSAYHAVHVGPCSVIRVASAWRKKLPTRKCGSAYPNCAICSPRCYGAGGTALNTCCIGPSGEDDISFAPCAATIESADRLCRSSIYNCSNLPKYDQDSAKAWLYGKLFVTLLTEKLIQHARALSPWGYPLAHQATSQPMA